MPFDGTNFARPDLSVPSLQGIAWLLRHQEAWPSGFVWKFSSFGQCAIALGKAHWPKQKRTVATFLSWRAFGLSHADTYTIFVEGALQSLRYPISAARIADRIDAYLAAK